MSASVGFQPPAKIELNLNLLPQTQRVELTDNHFSATAAADTFCWKNQEKDATDSGSDALLDSLASLHLEQPALHLVLTDRVARGSLGAVYQASFNTPDGVAFNSPAVVVKLVMGRDSVVSLRHEAAVYQQAKLLQGHVLPRYFGIYENGEQNAGCIVLESCGRPFTQPFEDLLQENKCAARPC